MCHVLLPCDLPTWRDVRGMLAAAEACGDAHQLGRLMDALLDSCNTSLVPDESVLPDEHPAVGELVRFLEEAGEAGFLATALPRLACLAAGLQRPALPLRYSLRGQESELRLDRELCLQLAAHAFFSTFPKRHPSTHPTLPDFRFAPFFAHLHRRGHRKKLKAFLRFFETVGSEFQGEVKISRKLHYGSQSPNKFDWFKEDALTEPFKFQNIFHCPSQVIEDALDASTEKETKLFFGCPELLTVLCCVETLRPDETLLVHVTDPAAQVILKFHFSQLPPECGSESSSFGVSDLPLNGKKDPLAGKDPDDISTKVSEPVRQQDSLQSHSSSRYSTRTRSSEFVTAEEESDEGVMPSHASSSRGFVLGGSSSHERLDDFRRRIGRRSRRRHSRRRSSSLGGSSSDMEDISEDPEDPPSWGPGALRPASSEPSLVNPQPFVHSE